MTSSPESAVTSPYLLSPEFLRKLEQAAVASRHVLVGRSRGERRSARKGTSVEFADFRSYVPGDDLRYLDWNAFARLRRLFVKLFVEEEDLHVYVLLDASRSMGFGTPSKFGWGVAMAAALGYMALCGGDRVGLLVHSRGEGVSSRIFRGRGSAREMFDWLAALAPDGRTDLPAAADWLVRTVPAPGLTFVISDLLSPDFEPALARLAVGRGEGCVLQVLAPEEFAPTVVGDIRLIDAETGEEQEVTMGTSVLRSYMQRRDEFLEAARAAAFRYGFAYLFATTDVAVEDAVLRHLRRVGVVK